MLNLAAFAEYPSAAARYVSVALGAIITSCGAEPSVGNAAKKQVNGTFLVFVISNTVLAVASVMLVLTTVPPPVIWRVLCISSLRSVFVACVVIIIAPIKNISVGEFENASRAFFSVVRFSGVKPSSSSCVSTCYLFCGTCFVFFCCAKAFLLCFLLLSLSKINLLNKKYFLFNL